MVLKPLILIPKVENSIIVNRFPGNFIKNNEAKEIDDDFSTNPSTNPNDGSKEEEEDDDYLFDEDRYSIK